MTTHRTTQQVAGGFVREYNGPKVDSPAWFTWLVGQKLFSFSVSWGSITVRRERMKRGGTYWYAYLKVDGKLRKTYIGKDEALTHEALLNAARRLAKGESKAGEPAAVSPVGEYRERDCTMAVQDRLYTAADLWVLSHQGKRYELNKGALIEMAPTGDRHGVVVVQVTYLLKAYLVGHALGELSGAETGYQLAANPDTVLAPDVGFIVKARLMPMTGKYYTMAPDLAVEVVSPNDRPGEVRNKANRYLTAGTRLVWAIDPEKRKVTVYRQNHAPRSLELGSTLDGGDVLPGFTVPVSEIFAGLRD